MGMPCMDEFLRLFQRLRRLRQLAFSRQRHQRQMFWQLGLILRRMKTFVEATRIQLRKALFRRHHHRHRRLIIRGLLQNLMMQDELMLVFQYAHLDAQLDWNTRLAFADPFGVRFKYREYLLGMRDDFAHYHATPRLLNLAYRVSHKPFNLEVLHNAELTGQSALLKHS